jgi:hypothetical protein
MMTSSQRIEWVLVSVGDCAGKVVGQGLNVAALQSRLSGFMNSAKAPRESGKVPAQPAVPEPDGGWEANMSDEDRKAMGG